MSTPATFKSFGDPLQATSPFPHSSRKPRLRLPSSPLSNMMVSPFMPSTSRHGRPSSGLVTGHGTRETRHHNVCRLLTAVRQGSPRPNSTDHSAAAWASLRRRFVTMVSVSVTTSSFTTASPCRRFVRIATVTMSCLTMSCFFAASRIQQDQHP